MDAVAFCRVLGAPQAECGLHASHIDTAMRLFASNLKRSAFAVQVLLNRPSNKFRRPALPRNNQLSLNTRSNRCRSLSIRQNAGEDSYGRKLFRFYRSRTRTTECRTRSGVQ